jgi:hypothetical protein
MEWVSGCLSFTPCSKNVREPLRRQSPCEASDCNADPLAKRTNIEGMMQLIGRCSGKIRGKSSGHDELALVLKNSKCASRMNGVVKWTQSIV